MFNEEIPREQLKREITELMAIVQRDGYKTISSENLFKHIRAEYPSYTVSAAVRVAAWLMMDAFQPKVNGLIEELYKKSIKNLEGELTPKQKRRKLNAEGKKKAASLWSNEKKN